MADTLNVYFKNKLAGYLTYDNGLLSFQYDKDYITNNDRAPLSASLPLNDTIFNDNVDSFHFRHVSTLFFYILYKKYRHNTLLRYYSGRLELIS